MVHIILVQFLIFLSLAMPVQGQVKMDRIHSEGYLGEKRLDSYSSRWQPLIFMDFYQGKMAFQDELFFQNYFQDYIFNREKDFSSFLKSELGGGMICSNELLSEHFDVIRYSYRLLTLSYLLEGQWHLNMVSKHFIQNKGCNFDFSKFVDKCRPKNAEMKKFIGLLKMHKPKFEESLPKTYMKSDWWKDFSSKDFKYYSHYRLDSECKGKCETKDLESRLKKVCEQDESLMNLICSEIDEIYGVSESTDAYNLIGISNIINTYNKQLEALGCLRRFTEVMAHKEVKYPILPTLFTTLRAHLHNQYQERFIQGRVFFYGSGKEFVEKGLTNLYVMEQPFKIAALDAEEGVTPIVIPNKIESPVIVAKKVEPKVVPVIKKKEYVETIGPLKSAFLQAAEIRQAQNLEQVEVDMLKLKYDYVFTLNMINNLSGKLKKFMSREALTEMVTYDKLGSKEGPVPLLFVKFMIDMQEHTGLYNMLNIIGDEFYVSNEIDSNFKTNVERIRIVNNESTGKQWQIYLVRP
jgi:hypothetical protein